MNEFVSKRANDFLEKINLIRFFPNLSFILVSVLIYLLIDFGLFCLLVSTWGRYISEHYCLNQAWIKHTFTPTEGETHSKLQLFLFTSSVSIALYAFVRGKGCVCVEHRPSVGVDGCRKHCNWPFDALCLMVRCVCVCACVHVSCWCWFAVVFRIEQIDHVLLYVLICKMIQNQQIEYSSYMGCQLCWLQPIFCTVLIAMSGIQTSQ